MVSNGLSKRRHVLKRPLVCKSKQNPNCGDCELTAEPAVNQVPPNTNLLFIVELFCDPDPTILDYVLQVSGAFTPVNPLPEIQPNKTFDVILRSPATLGDYLIEFDARNATRCRNFVTVQVSVV